MAKMNKAQLNATVSEDVKQKTEEYGASGRYGSASNFVESALLYYMGALDKEKELRYEECKRELETLRVEYNKQSTLLIKLLSNHNELIDEVNDLERGAQVVTSNMRKVTFE